RAKSNANFFCSAVPVEKESPTAGSLLYAGVSVSDRGIATGGLNEYVPSVTLVSTGLLSLTCVPSRIAATVVFGETFWLTWFAGYWRLTIGTMPLPVTTSPTLTSVVPLGRVRITAFSSSPSVGALIAFMLPGTFVTVGPVGALTYFT